MSLFWWAESVCALYLHHFIMSFEENVQLLGSKSSAGPVFLKANLNYCCFDCFASHACGRGPLTIACQNAGSRVPCLTSLKHSAVASHQISVYQSRSAFFWRTCLFFLLSICHSFRHLHIQLYKWLKHFSVGLYWNRNISPFAWVGVRAFRRLL